MHVCHCSCVRTTPTKIHLHTTKTHLNSTVPKRFSKEKNLLPFHLQQQEVAEEVFEDTGCLACDRIQTIKLIVL